LASTPTTSQPSAASPLAMRPWPQGRSRTRMPAASSSSGRSGRPRAGTALCPASPRRSAVVVPKTWPNRRQPWLSDAPRSGGGPAFVDSMCAQHRDAGGLPSRSRSACTMARCSLVESCGVRVRWIRSSGVKNSVRSHSTSGTGTGWPDRATVKVETSLAPELGPARPASRRPVSSPAAGRSSRSGRRRRSRASSPPARPGGRRCGGRPPSGRPAPRWPPALDDVEEAPALAAELGLGLGGRLLCGAPNEGRRPRCCAGSRPAARPGARAAPPGP